MLEIFVDVWDLKEPFVISRSARTQTRTIRVKLTQDGIVGFGESVPNPRYNESIESVFEQLQIFGEDDVQKLTLDILQHALPAGAARNALDCALWDIKAKRNKTSVSTMLGLPYPSAIQTVQTISIGDTETMARSAKRLRHFSMIKVKLNTENIIGRIEAIRKQAPTSKILIDANESWSLDILKDCLPHLHALGVVMVEQPLAAKDDTDLIGFVSCLPIGADESCHTSKDIARLAEMYDVINIKLDKTGGLTEAIHLEKTAKNAKLDIMVGCMLGTSLSIAPAMIIASQASYVDLDAPALLENDCAYGVQIKDGHMTRLDERLWGGGI